MLLTGKVKEATTRTADGRRVYDAVVLDAPPTGRIGRFLNVTAETARLAKVGPDQDPERGGGRAAALADDRGARGDAAGGDAGPGDRRRDRRADRARPAGRQGDRQRDPARRCSPRGRVTQAELRRGLAAAGLPADKATVAGLHAEAKAHLARRELEESLRAELAELGRPMVELPLLPDGVDRAGLRPLAAALLGRPS